MPHDILRLDKIDDPQRSTEPPPPPMPIEDDAAPKPTWKTRVTSGFCLLVIALPAISAFVFWCFAVYAPTPLIKAAETTYPLTRSIVDLLAQPSYRLPDGDWLSRLVMEQPESLDPSRQSDLQQFILPGRITVDDLVLAVDFICAALQFLLLAVGLLFFRQRIFDRMLRNMAKKRKHLTRFSQRQLTFSAVFGILACVCLFCLLLNGGLISLMETHNSQEMRDFSDFLYQAGLMGTGAVPMVFGIIFVLVLSFSPKHRRALEEVRERQQRLDPTE